MGTYLSYLFIRLSKMYYSPTKKVKQSFDVACAIIIGGLVMKIMIVDDEPVQLKNLAGCIQIFKPSYIIFSARDGYRALQILRDFPIDLLISDIKMPNMDGLTLLAKAKELYPNLYTLVLSGYGEFEYAQKAIHLGVDGYLLKTLDSQELLHALEIAEKRVQSNKEKYRNEQNQLQMLEQLRFDSIEKEMEQIISGYMSISKSREILQSLKLFNSGVVVCVKSVQYMWDLKMQNAWKKMLTELVQGWGNAYTFRCGYRDGAVITIISCAAQPPGFFFKMLNETCQHFDAYPFVVGISAFSEQFDKHIDLAFRQATEACERSFFSPEKILFCYQDDTAMQPYLLGNIQLSEDEFRSFLSDGKPEEAAKILIHSAQIYIEQYHPYPSKFKEALLFCLWHVHGKFDGILDPQEVRCLVNHIDQMISNSTTLDELKNAIFSICCYYSALLEQHKKATKHKALEHSAELLRAEYARDWTLEELAEKVHFNPSYFSNLFKQQFGKGYSAYLNNIRIEKAAELLIETNMQVGAIAHQVGYTNTAYFIKIFRRKYGITPSEFRRRRNSNA